MDALSETVGVGWLLVGVAEREDSSGDFGETDWVRVGDCAGSEGSDNAAPVLAQAVKEIPITAAVVNIRPSLLEVDLGTAVMSRTATVMVERRQI